MSLISNISFINFGFRLFKDLNTFNTITFIRLKCKVKMLQLSNKHSYIYLLVCSSYRNHNALSCIFSIF